MKWILLICYLCGIEMAMGQELLGKSENEVHRFIDEKGGKIVMMGDTITCHWGEEDERGRIFNVAYAFVMKEKCCDSYCKIVDLHEYWVGVVKELVELKEAEGIGREFEVEGQSLFTEYHFEESILELKVERGKLIMTFKQGRNRGAIFE